MNFATQQQGLKHPRIFVSYSHDDGAHKEKVLELAEHLRINGYDTMIDRYVEGTPPQGWPRWMLNQIEWADYVLLVCTKTYYERFRGNSPPGIGKGVDWEGAVITNQLYEQKSVSRKFVPLLLAQSDHQYIPEPLRTHTFYVIASAVGNDALMDYLAGAAGVQPAQLGPPPRRARRSGTRPRLGGAVEQPASALHVCAPPDFASLSAPGGTMAASDGYYVERAADRSAEAAALRSCETVVIRGPHQFGKSSLLSRYLARCRRSEKRVAHITFSRFERNTISRYGSFLSTLTSELARRLQVSCAPADSLTQQEFLQFTESTLLPAVPGHVVFAFDETDRILQQPYAQDFFSMVRMWHNDRADPELEWHRVGIAITTSSEPKLFIDDPLRSPFSVGLRLSVNAFTLEEVKELNRRYGSLLSEADCLELHRLVGGHPFLTQEAYFALLKPGALSFGNLCEFSARHDGPFGEHLRAMLSNLYQRDGMLDALKQVASNGTVPREFDFYRLEGAGLVRELDGRIVLANAIYASFFGSL